MKNIINVDDISKYFIWLPQKTATRLSAQIFDNSDFHTFGNYNGFLTKLDKIFTHNHNCDFFRGHEDYKFILTVRNPYSLMVSFYKNWGCGCKPDDNYIDQFDQYVHDFLYFNPTPSWVTLLKNLHTRKPDYTIRIENLKEDYFNLPIIKKNNFYKNNTLDLKLSEIVGPADMNKNVKSLPQDWKLFYNKNLAEDVYYYFANYFEIFNYDKNSWKG